MCIFATLDRNLQVKAEWISSFIYVSCFTILIYRNRIDKGTNHWCIVYCSGLCTTQRIGLPIKELSSNYAFARCTVINYFFPSEYTIWLTKLNAPAIQKNNPFLNVKFVDSMDAFMFIVDCNSILGYLNQLYRYKENLIWLNNNNLCGFQIKSNKQMNQKLNRFIKAVFPLFAHE